MIGKGIKRRLIDSIYRTVPIDRFKYELLQKEEDLDKLLKTKYLIAPHFSGTNALLCFFEINHRRYSFIVDRTTIPYLWSKIDYDKVDLETVSITIDHSIYQGTVFDGVVHSSYNDSKKGNHKTFIINDIYLLRGESYIDIPLSKKMFYTAKYLNSNYVEGRSKDQLSLTANRLRPAIELSILKRQIPKIKAFHVRGVCFYPEISGTKQIFLFNRRKTSTTSKQIKNHYSTTKDKIVHTQRNILRSIPTLKPGITSMLAVLLVRSTPIKGIFKLYCNSSQGDIEMGIAFLKGKKLQSWCENIVNKYKGETVMECSYNTDEHKWTPIKKVSSKVAPTDWETISHNFD